MTWYQIVASILMIGVIAFLGQVAWKKWRKPQVANAGTPSNTTTTQQPQCKVPWGKVIGGLAAAVVILAVGYQIYRWETYNPNVIVVTDAWTEWKQVPLGEQVIWDHRENVAYQVEIQSGKRLSIPRDPEDDERTACDRQIWIDQRMSAFRLRLTDKERKSATFDLKFSNYTEGGPCGKATMNAVSETGTEEEEDDIAPLPDGIPAEPQEDLPAEEAPKAAPPDVHAPFYQGKPLPPHVEFKKAVASS